MKNLLKFFAGVAIAVSSLPGTASSPSVPFGQYSNEPWDAKSFYSPSLDAAVPENWFAKDYDDSSWTSIQGPIGSDTDLLSFIATPWNTNYSYHLLRREFEISDLSAWQNPQLVCLHDDGCIIYLNGNMIYSNDSYINNATFHFLTDDEKKMLVKGKNVLAVYVSDTGAGEKFCDFGMYTNPWIEVNLETPGSLGVEILYQVDRLSDVSFLRISGPLNDADWTTIRNLNNLAGLDLEKADSPAIPNEAFYNRTRFSYIRLPENLTIIGNKAFRNTNIGELYIPASVNTIGSEAFYGSNVRTVEFDNDCKVTAIPSYAFAECRSLTDIKLPDNGSLSEISEDAFNYCERLKSVNLPGSLTYIAGEAFRYTTSLQTITFPESLRSIDYSAFYNSGLLNVTLPPYLTNLGGSAFENCKNLTDLYIPPTIHSLSSQFRYCTSLKKVVCAVATPPSITNNNNPFYNVSLSKITLVTPEFAVADYKLDSYWLGFGKVEGGAVSDVWPINSPLNLSNGRRMDGAPTVVLQPGAKLQVSGAAPMTMKYFGIINDFYNYSSGFSYGQLINSCPAMTAAGYAVSVNLRKEKWFFISLPFDVRLSDVRHASNDASFVVRHYDGAARAEKNTTGSSWQDLPSDYVLKAGEGYIVMSNFDGELNFPSAGDASMTLFNPNAQIVELDENASENAAHAGWNFIANPYPSHYDMYYSMLTSPITVWNHKSNQYVAYSLIDDDVVLYPNQPFFIQSSADVKAVEFGTQGRQFTTAISRTEKVSARSGNVSDRCLFNISLASGDHRDVARVVFNEEASMSYEQSRDASKFFSDDAAMPQLYTIDPDSNQLSINERPADDGRVAVGFYAPEAGRFTLSISRCDGTATVFDAETGENKEITTECPYTFDVTRGGTVNDRFMLILSSKENTGIEGVSTPRPVISVDSGSLNVSGCAGERVEVFFSNGMKVASVIASDSLSISLAPGFYLVKVAGNTEKCIVK